MMHANRASSLIQILAIYLGIIFAPFANADELRIVATIKPVHSILSGLMEGIEQPLLLIEGSPYKYSPDKDIQSMLAESDLVVWVGPELEASMQAPLSLLPASVKVMELLSSSNLKILSKRNDDTQRDPFFWLDSRNSLILLDELAQALIEIDPVRTHLYTSNRRKMRTELRKFDREMEYGYRGLQGGVGYFYHDTQQYFEQAYALKAGGELLESPDSTVDATKLLKVRSQLTDGDFDCLLTERGMPDSYLNLLKPEDGGHVWQLESLGLQFEPGAKLYINLMQYNSSVIKHCLQINGGDLERIDSALKKNLADSRDSGLFIMINHLGEVVTEGDMLGKYQLLFFGYTSCPDVCPLALHTLVSALEELGESAQQFQAYFITVDPERDDVMTMRRYVDYFENRVIGLTGQQPMLRQIAKHYHVKYERVYADSKNRDNYQMDHTAGLFVVAPDGQFITKLAHGISPGTMAKALKAIIK
jgi:protein SCO1/2